MPGRSPAKASAAATPEASPPRVAKIGMIEDLRPLAAGAFAGDWVAATRPRPHASASASFSSSFFFRGSMPGSATGGGAGAGSVGGNASSVFLIASLRPQSPRADVRRGWHMPDRPLACAEGRPEDLRHYLTGPDAQRCRLVKRVDGAVAGSCAARGSTGNIWPSLPSCLRMRVWASAPRSSAGWPTRPHRPRATCGSAPRISTSVPSPSTSGVTSAGSIVPDLVAPDATELLLRKRLPASPATRRGRLARLLFR
jgi:hypothetical protein